MRSLNYVGNGMKQVISVTVWGTSHTVEIAPQTEACLQKIIALFYRALNVESLCANLQDFC